MGRSNSQDLQYYKQWNGQTEIEVPVALNLSTGGFIEDGPWGTPEANRVEGYAGYLFPPGQSPNAELRIWVPATGRAFNVQNTNGAKLNVRGIELLQFEIPESEFADGETNPTNREWYNNYNASRGLLNISSLSFGAPTFISKPHFLDVDPAFVTDCGQCIQFDEGFREPDRNLDEIIIAIEPRTGVNMYARQRLQTNFQLRPAVITAGFWEYWPNINQEAVLPIFILDLNGVVSADQANTFKNTIILALDAAQGVGTTFNVLAGATFCACAFFSYKWLNMQKNAGASVDGPLSPNDVPSLSTDLISAEEAGSARSHVL
jgi:hypothetical protein